MIEKKSPNSERIPKIIQKIGSQVVVLCMWKCRTHIMRDCELMKKVRAESSGATTRPKMRSAVAIEEDDFRGNVCFAAFEEEIHDGWFLDSGASSHMRNRADLLNSIEKIEKRNVLLANGEMIRCDTKGEITVSADDGEGCSVSVSLTDVMVVPDLSANVVSVPAITKRGFVVVFKTNECNTMKDSKIVIVGKKVGELYRLNM